ncbi:DBH-like monooxygenase protein 2 homolog isoform X2 [Folsomia candida]|nr:DBH-like monooxygenase protein 2 homolog isoform X2 [Folsomia candida]XP_035704418.1 DBH-like monooxygenase protein 2 homolog isoform X2 [Folsomia candida]
MTGADIFIAGVGNDGQPYFSDRIGVGFTTPKIDDNQDWILLNSSETNGLTYLKFSRLLDTCDDEDYPITMDTNRLIWAMGSSDAIEYHTSERRGARSISLLGAPTPDINLDQMMYWDMTVDMAMPAQSTIYWCSFHKGPILDYKHHIVAFDAVLDNEMALTHTHHYILYNCYVPAGSNSTADEVFGNYTVDVGHNGNECYGPGSSQIPNQYCKEYLFVWAKGGKMMVFPENVGYPISEGSDAGIHQYYMLEIHYDNVDELSGPSFKTGTRVYYTDNLRPIDAGLMTIGHQVDVSLTVPPNTQDYVVVGHCSPTCTLLLPLAGVTIFNALLHSHLAGRVLRLRHFRGNIELPWIDNEEHYDFDYQQNKHLSTEVRILPGDQITYECTYDSTWKNGSIVSGGMTTIDEMCESFIWYYPKNSFDHCISHTEIRSHMSDFGVTGYRRETSSGIPKYVITAPESLVGDYDDSISFKFNWTSEFQAEYTQKRQFGGHQAFCISEKTGQSITVPNQRYPDNLVEYVPYDRCAKKKNVRAQA